MANNVSVEDLMFKFLVSIVDSSRNCTRNCENVSTSSGGSCNNNDNPFTQQLSCSITENTGSDNYDNQSTIASSFLPCSSFPNSPQISTTSEVLSPSLVTGFHSRLMLSLDYDDLMKSYYQQVSIESNISNNENHKLNFAQTREKIVEEKVATCYSISKVSDSYTKETNKGTKTIPLNGNTASSQTATIQKGTKTVQRRSIMRRRSALAYDEQSTMQFYFPLWVFHQVSNNKKPKKHL